MAARGDVEGRMETGFQGRKSVVFECRLFGLSPFASVLPARHGGREREILKCVRIKPKAPPAAMIFAGMA